MKQIFLFIFLNILCITLISQPNDVQIKKDAIGTSGASIKSFKFTKTTGTRQWNSSLGNWEYVRGVEVLRKSDYPGIDVIVIGDVVYQYTGAAKYSYLKFRVIQNEYVGIPNPTESEIQKFISADWEKFYGSNHLRNIHKLNSGPTLADEPKWFWHSPKSVSFKMKLNVDYIVAGKGIETIDCIWDVRFYRDDIKGDWQNMITNKSQDANETKVLKTVNNTTEQLNAMKNKTLAYTIAEQQSEKLFKELPQVGIPNFDDEEAMAKYLHDLFLNGTAEKARSVLIRLLHPGHFNNGSKVQLDPYYEQSLQKALLTAYSGKATYKMMYCQNAPIKVDKYGGNSKRAFYFSGTVKDCVSYFIIGKVNDGYKEGVPQTSLKIFEYGINVRQDDDAINYVNSFSNRQNLCKQD